MLVKTAKATVIQPPQDGFAKAETLKANEVFPLKLRDEAIGQGFAYLRSKKLVPEQEESDDEKGSFEGEQRRGKKDSFLFCNPRTRAENYECKSVTYCLCTYLINNSIQGKNKILKRKPKIVILKLRYLNGFQDIRGLCFEYVRLSEQAQAL